MAHLIDLSNNRENMAYVGQVPWHGLGQRLTENSPIEKWIIEAGFNWEVKRAPVQFHADGFGLQGFENRYTLYRSDTGAGLGLVAGIYKPVQPKEVLEFYRDLTEAADFQLETAGMLKGGAMYWALARTGRTMNLGGRDDVNGYLLLATANDGTLATTAAFTSVRVVCNNTLTIAVNREEKAKTGIKIPHVCEFDPQAVKKELGIVDGVWEQFEKEATDMSKATVSREEALKFFLDTIYPKKQDFEKDKLPPTIGQLVNIFHNGVGQNTAAAKGTVWGLVNAVTRFVDHEKKSFSADAKLRSAWFGEGERVKQRAYEIALDMVA
jgi:phage/plasmid-like protein (TIGR03299 family)